MYIHAVQIMYYIAGHPPCWPGRRGQLPSSQASPRGPRPRGATQNPRSRDVVVCFLCVLLFPRCFFCAPPWVLTFCCFCCCFFLPRTFTPWQPTSPLPPFSDVHAHPGGEGQVMSKFVIYGMMGMGYPQVPQNPHDLHPLPGWTY